MFIHLIFENYSVAILFLEIVVTQRMILNNCTYEAINAH